jgi:hypothetical protein
LNQSLDIESERKIQEGMLPDGYFFFFFRILLVAST